MNVLLVSKDGWGGFLLRGLDGGHRVGACLRGKQTYLSGFFDTFRSLPEAVRAVDPDVVINDGPGTVPHTEPLSSVVPVVGCPLGDKLGADSYLQMKVLQQIGVRTVSWADFENAGEALAETWDPHQYYTVSADVGGSEWRQSVEGPALIQHLQMLEYNFGTSRLVVQHAPPGSVHFAVSQFVRAGCPVGPPILVARGDGCATVRKISTEDRAYRYAVKPLLPALSSARYFGCITVECCAHGAELRVGGLSGGLPRIVTEILSHVVGAERLISGIAIESAGGYDFPDGYVTGIQVFTGFEPSVFPWLDPSVADRMRDLMDVPSRGLPVDPREWASAVLGQVSSRGFTTGPRTAVVVDAAHSADEAESGADSKASRFLPRGIHHYPRTERTFFRLREMKLCKF